jgi:protein-disulfide isomerase
MPDKPTGPMSLSVGASAVLGSDSAPVTMFAYNDYICSECASYATDVLPEIVDRYVETGSLRIVMREYPNREAGKRGLQASKLAICAGRQGTYLEMHDWLYANQGAGAKGGMQDLIQQLGLDSDEFRSCVRGEDVKNQLRANLEEARKSPIQSGPGFQLGLTDPDDPGRVTVTRHLDGSPQLADFQAAIDELLIAAGASN